MYIHTDMDMTPILLIHFKLEPIVINIHLHKGKITQLSLHNHFEMLFVCTLQIYNERSCYAAVLVESVDKWFPKAKGLKSLLAVNYTCNYISSPFVCGKLINNPINILGTS